MEVSLSALSDFAKDFAARLPKILGEKAHIIGLEGELGAGKTTFVQHLAQELGISHRVTSPTFVIAKVYPLSGGEPFKRVVHLDAYRLAPGERDTFGWGEYANDPENLIFVEWPENLGGFPEDARRLRFTVSGEDARDIEELS